MGAELESLLVGEFYGLLHKGSVVSYFDSLTWSGCATPDRPIICGASVQLGAFILLLGSFARSAAERVAIAQYPLPGRAGQVQGCRSHG